MSALTDAFLTLYEEQRDHFWLEPGPTSFSQDRVDWREMPLSVRTRIKIAVHLLAQMDVEVVENLDGILQLLDKDLDAVSMCLRFQQVMEDIHTRAYKRIDSELEHPLEDTDLESIHLKVAQLGSYRQAPLASQVLAQVCAEGISFVTLFPLFYYLRKGGKLKETGVTNDEVLRDENMHTQAFLTLYRSLCSDGRMKRLPVEEAHAIVSSFVTVEDQLADVLYGDQTQEEKEFFTVMTPANSRQYTRLTANSVLVALGYPILYEVEDTNPFPFVNQSLLSTLTGFFDTQGVDYGMRTDHPVEDESDPE